MLDKTSAMNFSIIMLYTKCYAKIEKEGIKRDIYCTCISLFSCVVTNKIFVVIQYYNSVS